ncbi:MAG: hypothetical protein MRY32_04190 [Rickettsiales bacterium]|nr:hypothetical protein [Rickettsiales bacterium]
MDESEIITEFASSGWVGEFEKYYLSQSQMDEILHIYNFDSERKQQEFSQDVNKAVAEFCYGVERYSQSKGATKISTELRDKCEVIAEKLDGIIPLVEELNGQELEWLLENQGGIDVSAEKFLNQLSLHLMLLKQCAVDNGMKVKTGSPPFLRGWIRRCIIIVERHTDEKVVREPDPIKGGDNSLFSTFMVTLYHHIPQIIKDELPQKSSSLEGAISEAISENK